MFRIYVRRKNEIAGHTFICKSSIKKDRVAILPFVGFVTSNIISEEEWAKSQELIVDKFELYVAETYIDGRSKVAHNTKKFSWKDILKMKIRDTFKPVGFKSLCNFFGIEIEISKCGSAARYRIGEKSQVSDWKEIRYTENGRPYFSVSKKAHGCTRYYLDEFEKIAD